MDPSTAQSSLQVTDAQSAAVATHPRVSLADIEGKIATVNYLNAFDAVEAAGAPAHSSLAVLTLCLIVMANGFTVIGKSAPASPENFNADLGRQFAREDAIRQIWPLEGYALRERIMAAEDLANPFD